MSPQDVAAAIEKMSPWGNLADEWAAEHCVRAARLVREHLIPKWSHTRPDKEGYYWHRLSDSVAVPTIRRIYQGPRGLLLDNQYGGIEIEMLTEANLWQGPLLIPPAT